MGKKKSKAKDAKTTINGIDYKPFDLHGKNVLQITNKSYEKELERLQLELVKLQEWVKAKGLKVVVIFEGRDAAGKGGVIKRITEAMNPRICRVEALSAPTPKESSQWYFQRYVAKLPAAGEIVLFDRSWYNRAGVERVMGFCNEEELREFLRACPEFEKMLIRSGIMLIKYWFSVSDEEQEERFKDRINDPAKRWKLSPMDLAARSRWSDYSRAKDEMFSYTDTKQSPWYTVDADIKKHARLNCISHLLSLIPYEDLTPEKMKLPPRQDDDAYVRPPLEEQTFVPDLYGGDFASLNSKDVKSIEHAKDTVISNIDEKPKANDGKVTVSSKKTKKTEKKEDATTDGSAKKSSKK
ncbi:MAG TPA: polyphosphate kinase 2 [Clostridiaceae bacterium]|nr:polyphosphate kinase 2 [Clostridiaceae bacterium]